MTLPPDIAAAIDEALRAVAAATSERMEMDAYQALLATPIPQRHLLHWVQTPDSPAAIACHYPCGNARYGG